MLASLSLSHKQLLSAVEHGETTRLESTALLEEVKTNPKALLESGKAAKMQRVIAADLDIMEKCQRIRASVDVKAATATGTTIANVVKQPCFNPKVVAVATNNAEEDIEDFWNAAVRCLGYENPDVGAAALQTSTAVLNNLCEAMMNIETEEEVAGITEVMEAAVEAGLLAEILALVKTLPTMSSLSDAMQIAKAAAAFFNAFVQLPTEPSQLMDVVVCAASLVPSLPIPATICEGKCRHPDATYDAVAVASLADATISLLQETLLVNFPELLSALKPEAQASKFFADLLHTAKIISNEILLGGVAASEKKEGTKEVEDASRNVLDVSEDSIDVINGIAKLFAEGYPGVKVLIDTKGSGAAGHNKLLGRWTVEFIVAAATCSLPKSEAGVALPFVSQHSAKQLMHEFRMLGVAITGAVLTQQPSALVDLLTMGFLGCVGRLTENLASRDKSAAKAKANKKRRRDGTEKIEGGGVDDAGDNDLADGSVLLSTVELATLLMLWEQTLQIGEGLQKLSGGSDAKKRIRAKFEEGSVARKALDGLVAESHSASVRSLAETVVQLADA